LPGSCSLLNVPGVTTGGTDSDFFNGQATELNKLRLKTAAHIPTAGLEVAAAVEGDDGDAVMGSASR